MLKRGVFAVQHCIPCDTAQFPPVTTCRTCGAPDPVLIPAKGIGTVYATTTVRTREAAYDVSIIELAEGPRMMSRVEGVEAENVRIGQPVRARINTDGEMPLVVFDVAGDLA
ncbi:OB-fold domain-containing protein [Roseovarius sp. MBR-6]|jgi:uncharacterized OB-fold protein|uniref:Zn-ribbon domain-containing OB-fold protein n=1 Tax=Roseovarius sp. MBR-6 TaxID=3156459 RepID=UPI0033957304